MPIFDTTRRVQHTAAEMFDLVADVRAYPEFLPFCTGLDLLEQHGEAGREVFVARMQVGFKAVRESFKTRVSCDKAANHIDVEYIDGPFRYLKNRWAFRNLAEGQGGVHASEVIFHIEYEFKSRMLALLVGSMFDQAFRTFTTAFERRADRVYGRPVRPVPAAGRAGQAGRPRHFRPPSSVAAEQAAEDRHRDRRPADNSA